MVADRLVQRPCARRRRSSSAAARGSMPARHSDFVDEQVAEPGDARLVHQHGLDRRGARARARGRAARAVSVSASGPRRDLVGIELDRAEPARVAEHERAAVGEVHAEAMPLRRRGGCSRRRADRRPPRRRRARGRSCRGARRAARRDPSVSSTICLPMPARRGERVADRARAAARRAVVPRFRNHVSGACTVAISRSSARASSTARAASTSRISGTGWAATQMFVIAPVSAPCASWAYLARKPLV